MKKMKWLLLTIGIVWGQVDYTQTIQPIFTASCTSCHGSSGGLSLASYSSLMAGGNSGAAVVAGDHASSLLWQKVNNGSMPQGNQTLSSDQINQIAQWINEGALETPAVDFTGLFFSEYAEGSVNHKYLEIYNGTGSDIDLSDCALVRYNNGSTTNESLYALSGTLSNGDVYVIANSQADENLILIHNDDDGTNMQVTYFNGNDYLGLIHDANNDGTFDNSSEVIDVIGVLGEGETVSGWDVAGVSTATANHTLVRKSTVTSGNTDWSASAGTTTGNSEWIVLEQNNWEYIGSHPHPALESPIVSITSPTAGETLYSSDLTVSFSVNNFTVAESDGDGHIHYSLDGGTPVMQYTVDDIELTDLTVSAHTFVIWLVDNNHANLDPYAGDTVSFIIEEPLTITPIYDIQSGAIADSTPVTIRGVVTAGTGETPDASGYSIYIQDGQGQYSGINVYKNGIDVSRGDSIEVTGLYVEYYGKSEITDVSSVVTLATGISLPGPEILTLDQSDWEPWEGVLIKIQNLTVTLDDAGYGEWEVSDGTGVLLIDNTRPGMYTYSPNEEDIIAYITGPLNYSYDNYKLIARDDNDIGMADGPPVITGVSFSPSSPTATDDVTVTASITDGGTIASATLMYNTGGTNTDVAMANTTGDIYSGTIPAQVVFTTVMFAITAVDDEGNSNTSSTGSYFVVASGGPTTAIYDIQYTTDPSGLSPLHGQTLSISGIVTAEFWGSDDNRTSSTYDSDDHKFMAVQDENGPWNGIVCYNTDGWDTFDFITSSGLTNSVAEGDSITLTGTVGEDAGVTQIIDITQAIIHGPAVNKINPTLVTPDQIMTNGTDAEAYEGCLVSVENAIVDDPDLNNGEWSITDGTNSVRVDDKWAYYFWPESGQALAQVVGVMDYTFENTKIQPRLARDIVEANGEPVRMQRIQQVLYSDLIKSAVDTSSDKSYMLRDTVTVQGIVTMPNGLSYAGDGVKFIFADIHGGPWSAILSYDQDSSAFPVLFEGDLVQATGYIYEFSTSSWSDPPPAGSNMTELFISEPVNIVDFEQPLPPVSTVNTGDLRWPTTAEQWGNVMVRVEDAIVTNNNQTEIAPLQYEVFAIDDGTGEVLVDDDSDSLYSYFQLVSPPPVGSLVQSIEGWVYHHYGSYLDSTAYKLCPLYLEDVVFGAGPPTIFGVSREPCAPMSTDTEVTVSCVITDNSNVVSAEIHYSIDGGAYETVSMASAGDTTWAGVIPVANNNRVNYYITATDDGVDQAEAKTRVFPYNIENDQLGFVVTDELTIAHVQETIWLSGTSPYKDCLVTVSGTVTIDSYDYTSGSYHSYAMQSSNSQWSGLFFDGSSLSGSSISRGDNITITGKVAEHYGSTKIINVTEHTINSSGNEISARAVQTIDLNQNADEVESYEGLLVSVTNVSVVDTNRYDWSIKDGSQVPCLMDDDMATMAANNFMSALTINQNLENVMGVFNYSFNTYKIQIRDLADLGQTMDADDDVNINPFVYRLGDNFPNPFNPEWQV